MKATTLSFHVIVTDRRQDLVETLCKRLKSSDAPNYRNARKDELHQRCERLVDAFVQSANGDPAPFASYVETLTTERIAEGYFLGDIQLALSILEEQAWQIAVETSTWTSLVPHLTLITTTIGRAKDRLAQIYLEHKERAESRIGQLERQLDALFKGTESSVIDEDEGRGG